MTEAVYSFDLSILLWIQSHLRCGILDFILPTISTMANAGILWIVIAIVLFFIPKTRNLGLCMALCLAIEYLCNDLILKPLVQRPRPFIVYPGLVELIVSAPHGFSFPSGHTSAAFAATTSLFCNKSNLRIPALLLCLTIAFSRIYLFVHFPTDILGGAIVGIFAGIVGSTLFRRIIASRNNR